EVVLFGGLDGPALRGDTWGYRVRQVHTDGDPCTGDGECYSGACAQGVCCDRPCDGACRVCNGSGAVGRCIALAAGADGGACGAVRPVARPPRPARPPAALSITPPRYRRTPSPPR